MADFNQVLDPGNYQEGFINTVIEISKGSNLKIEWDPKRAAFRLDRVEPSIYPKPVNYGFIPQTIDEDGDELDTLVICDESLPTGIWLEAKIIGLLNFEDDNQNDYKIVCVPNDNRNNGDSINSLNDLSDQLKLQIEEHFKHYKDLKKPGSTIVKGWEDEEKAKQIITECIQRYQAN
ncbi:MAG: inorganic diphosphatase [Patescibacteria group bacterium]|jgi:inorganic pyrophosphatase|nr:inorganic diphosphatase [Patescibacteria group bacterium]